MKRSQSNAIIVITLATGLALVTLFDSRCDEPSFRHKKLRDWLTQLDQWSGDTNAMVVKAIRAIGTNGAPVLVKESLHQDSKVRQLVQMEAELSSLPFHLTTAAERSGRANLALRLLGRQAEAALPAFLKALTNVDYQRRRLAIGALGQLGSIAEPCIPTMIDCRNDPAVRSQVMLALGFIGKRPDLCQPVLLQALTDSDPLTRKNAAYSLRQLQNSTIESND